MTDRAPLAVQAITLAEPFRHLDVVDEVGSTNAALLGRPGGSVLVAEHQSAGRGRLERTWESPPGAGLTFSVRLVPAVPIARLPWLPLLAGVALHRSVPGSTLKWPNDLLIGARKAAGILAQVDGDGVIVGVGLNVSTTPEELPVPTATSLLIEGLATDREALLGSILSAWGALYLDWVAAGGDAERSGLAPAYRAACSTIGRQVRVSGAAAASGLAGAIDSCGRLVVGGVAVAAGDVEHVRALRQ